MSYDVYDKTEYNVVNNYKARLDIIYAPFKDWSKPIKSQTAWNNHDVWLTQTFPKERILPFLLANVLMWII